MCDSLPTKSYSAFLFDQELLCELHTFLQNNTSESESFCETAQPPCKRIRFESIKEEAEEQTPNGSHQLTNAEMDGNATDEDLRPSVCTVCLGILQELCEMNFVKAVCQKISSSEYQFSSFVFSVSFPPQLSVREGIHIARADFVMLQKSQEKLWLNQGWHASWLLVKEEMGKQDHLLEKDDLIQLKEAYKWITHPLFLEELGVPADGKSLFEVSVVFAHPETDEDCHFLMAVVKALDLIDDNDFHKNFQCPPSSPKTPCSAVDIQCTNSAVFVAGRYNKYSRTLPQTPWIIDGERKMESSVEELISEHLMATFKADSFNFSSSGREDVDVRTLGNGRPFAIELVNPRRVHLTAEEMKALQQTINNASDKVQVRDLQIVTREAIGHMKEGEEDKTKSYSALIWTEKEIKNEDIAVLDSMKELKLDQKTPLRVLHRRPLAVRVRVIHTIRSEYIDEHHFRLYLKTQAGTYPS
uniref:tRNA pseudouridine synthase Pus10 n=1 Tax=Sphaerodactylus townsendi TaxID=933632 RepID=A0ACB8G9P0_9SAUR